MIRPRKSFAQHWLKSEKALDAIIKAAECRQSDRILEIGPGTGILTRRLLPHVQSLIAVQTASQATGEKGQLFTIARGLSDLRPTIPFSIIHQFSQP